MLQADRMPRKIHFPVVLPTKVNSCGGIQPKECLSDKLTHLSREWLRPPGGERKLSIVPTIRTLGQNGRMKTHILNNEHVQISMHPHAEFDKVLVIVWRRDE
jgi:hypothetical protein